MNITAPTSRRLDGKTALVTGASRGIGLGIARRLVDEGARVLLTARGAEALDEVARTFPKGSVLTSAGKADDPVHRGHALDLIEEEFGGLDILVNNAGINPVYGSLLELPLDGARKILEVNVVSALAWVQDVVHRQALQFAVGRGAVVIVSSVTGQTPSPGIGWYGISKAANAHLARTLAVELAPNIRVNAVAPAVVRTDFAKALYEGRESEVADAYPMKRLGDTADVAAAVAFLCSDDAGWVTGQVLTVDGGLLTAGGTA